jgi:hypothetical protein
MSLLDLSKRKLLDLQKPLEARRIIAKGMDVPALPPLRCDHLELQNSAVEVLRGVEVRHRIDATGCKKLKFLPPNLKVGSLVLRDCTSLTELPSGLVVNFLDLDGCTALTKLPDDLKVISGRLSLRNCAQIVDLPRGVGPLAELNLDGCAKIATLPELVVHAWIDLAGTALTALPAGARGAQLRWRGIPVDEQIVFHPEELKSRQILETRNAELRRVMLERMGFSRFLEEAKAEILDRDRDPGGERTLVKVAMEGDEDLVCLCVQCPSTARRYVIRVPPATTTCRQGAAWMAGFDDPNAYEPVTET